jgi:branched-subunit amino acid aminotransferase/4-amino-4-deoxychorismate lyase
MAKNDSTARPAPVFFNGEILPSEEACVSIGDQGLLYGFGFFETFRTSGGNLHHWQFNHARLSATCEKAALVLPRSFLAHDGTKLGQVIRALLDKTGRTDAVFRYTVTSGSSTLPTEILTTRALPIDPAAEGIRLRVLKLRRDSGEWIPRPKSLNYLNAFLGSRELQIRNAAATDEGLFLSRADESVVETARQNVAWVVGGRIRFPDATTGAVAGTCLAWLQALGIPTAPARVSLAEFLGADAIFTLNSVRGISPVAEVWDESDASLLGHYNSVAHPLVRRLQHDWSDALAVTARKRM